MRQEIITDFSAKAPGDDDIALCVFLLQWIVRDTAESSMRMAYLIYGILILMYISVLTFFASLSLKSIQTIRSCAAEYERLGTENIIKAVRNKMSYLKSIYLTIDIDCMDPAYSAGTGTPKFWGLTSRQLLNLLSAIFI